MQMDSHPENAAMICRSFPAMLRAVQGHIYIRRFPECWTFALGRSDLRADAVVVLSSYMAWTAGQMLFFFAPAESPDAFHMLLCVAYQQVQHDTYDTDDDDSSHQRICPQIVAGICNEITQT